MLLGKQDEDKKRFKPHQGCGGGLSGGDGLPSKQKPAVVQQASLRPIVPRDLKSAFQYTF